MDDRVLRLWGDLERGYMGGVWVRRRRTREKRAAWHDEERLRLAAAAGI